MKIAIAIPVYNEELRVISTLDRVKRRTELPIFVLDDGSLDSTYDKLKTHYHKDSQIQLIQHVVNHGKGAAMRTLAEQCWRDGHEAIIFMDGDGQHSPDYIPLFAKKLQRHSLVFGFRLLNEDVPFLRKIGNKIIRLVARHLFNINRYDLLCGYFGLRKSVYEEINWQSNGYAVETEIATQVGKLKIPFVEIQVNTTYLKNNQGLNMWHALLILLQIPKWYILSKRK